MKKYYCNNCGREHADRRGKCNYCGELKKTNNLLFVDYLLDQTNSDIKGTIIDKFIDKLKYIIKKYLYAIIFSITVLGTIVMNIVVRNDIEIVHEKPMVENVVLSYYDIDSLISGIEKFMRVSDANSIKKLLYQNNFKDEAQKLGIDALDSVFFKHTKIGAYQKSYIEINVSEDNEQFSITRYCKSYQTDCIENLDASGNEFFSVSFYVGFYLTNYNGEEKTWVGKDDFEFIIVKVDDKYYLADIVTYISDPYIESVDGDASKLDYDKQMRYYVDGIIE